MVTNQPSNRCVTIYIGYESSVVSILLPLGEHFIGYSTSSYYEGTNSFSLLSVRNVVIHFWEKSNKFMAILGTTENKVMSKSKFIKISLGSLDINQLSYMEPVVVFKYKAVIYCQPSSISETDEI